MAKTIVIDTEVKGVDKALQDIDKIDNAVDETSKKKISINLDSEKLHHNLKSVEEAGKNIKKVGEGIIGGFSLANGVIGSMGDSIGFTSEEIAEAQEKTEAFFGVMTSIKPVAEGAGAAFKILGSILKTNPLILLATIIGGIIVSFLDMGAIVDVIKKGFKAFGDAVSATFDFIVDAAMFAIDMYTQFLDVVTFGLLDINGAYNGYVKSVENASAAEKKRQENLEKEKELLRQNIAELKKKSKSLDAEIKIIEKAKAAVTGRYDQEIRLAQASGKETYEIEKQKLADLIEFTNKEIDIKLKKYHLEKQLIADQQELNIKEFGEFYGNIRNKELESLKNQKKDNNERLKNIHSLREELNGFKNEDEVLDAGRNKENLDKWKENEEKKTAATLEANKIRTEKENEYLDTIAKLQEENFESTLSAEEREKRVVEEKYFALEEAAKNNAEQLAIVTEAKERELATISKKYRDEESRLIAEANALRLQKENEYLDTIAALEEQNFENTLTDEEKELRAIDEKYFALEQAAKDNAEELKIINEAKEKEINDTNKKYRDEDKEHQRKVQDAKVQMISDTLGTLSSLTELFGKKGEASAKKAFQINKAISIADAIVKTYQGANAIFATASANPKSVLFPAQPFIAAGLAIAGGFANVAKIAATQFGGGASASGGGGDSGFGSGPSLPTVDTSSTPFQFPTVGENNPQSNQQTFVSVTEINNVNNRVQVAEANATFG
jgi:hypothetical protein